MRLPSARLFPHSVLVRTNVATSGAGADELKMPSSGTPLSARVDIVRSNRAVTTGQVVSIVSHTVYFRGHAPPIDTSTGARTADPQIRDEDSIVWVTVAGNRILTALGPANDEGGGVLWSVDCEERQ